MPKFKHGTTRDDRGYPRLSCGPCRYMRVATLVAEGILKRKLKKDETVHHIDGNKKNCRWTNLVVLNESDHGFVSSKQKWFVEHRLHLHEQWQWEQVLKEMRDSDRETGFEFGNNASAQADGD